MKKGEVLRATFDMSHQDLWNQVAKSVGGAKIEEQATSLSGFFVDPSTLQVNGKPVLDGGVSYVGAVIMIGMVAEKQALTEEAVATATMAVTTAHALAASGNQQPLRRLQKCQEGLTSFWPANTRRRDHEVEDQAAVLQSFETAFEELIRLGKAGQAETPANEKTAIFAGVRGWSNTKSHTQSAQVRARGIVFMPSGDVGGQPFTPENCRQMLVRFGVNTAGLPVIQHTLSIPAVWDPAQRRVVSPAELVTSGLTFPTMVVNRGLAEAMAPAAWAAVRASANMLNSSASLLPLLSMQASSEAEDWALMPSNCLPGATVYQAAAACRNFLNAIAAQEVKRGARRQEPRPSELARALRELANRDFAWCHCEAFNRLADDIEATAAANSDAVADRWILRYLASRAGAGVTAAEAESRMWDSVEALSREGLFAMATGRHGASAMLKRHGFNAVAELLDIAMSIPPMAGLDVLTSRNIVEPDEDLLAQLLTVKVGQDALPKPTQAAACGLFGNAPAVVMASRQGSHDPETREIAKVSARPQPMAATTQALLSSIRGKAAVKPTEQVTESSTAGKVEELEASVTEEPASSVKPDDDTAALLADITEETFGNSEGSEIPASDAPAEDSQPEEPVAPKKRSRKKVVSEP